MVAPLSSFARAAKRGTVRFIDRQAPSAWERRGPCDGQEPPRPAQPGKLSVVLNAPEGNRRQVNGFSGRSVECGLHLRGTLLFCGTLPPARPAVSVDCAGNSIYAGPSRAVWR